MLFKEYLENLNEETQAVEYKKGAKHDKKLLHRYADDTAICVRFILETGFVYDLEQLYNPEDGYLSMFSNWGESFDPWEGKLKKGSKAYKALKVDVNKFKNNWTILGKKVYEVGKLLNVPNLEFLSDFLNWRKLLAYATFMCQKARWYDDSNDPNDIWLSIMEKIFILIPKAAKDVYYEKVEFDSVQNIVYKRIKLLIQELDDLEKMIK